MVGIVIDGHAGGIAAFRLGLCIDSPPWTWVKPSRRLMRGGEGREAIDVVDDIADREEHLAEGIAGLAEHAEINLRAK